jgi:hypothetical protein
MVLDADSHADADAEGAQLAMQFSAAGNLADDGYRADRHLGKWAGG